MSGPLERAPRPNKRVVVTGVGAVSPLGLSAEETWKNLLQGKSGIAKITRFDSTGYDVNFAGEVKNFTPDKWIDKKEQKKMDLFIQYSMASAQMALDMAQLKITPEIADRTGVLIGVGMGGLPMIEEQITKIREKGPSRLSPFFIPAVISNLAAGQISISVGAKGPSYAVTSACASGVHALGEAYNYIRSNECDVVISGGAESTVCGPGVGGFASMRALSTRNDDPERASRPFDRDRDGFVLAEGGAVLILESLEHALKRGAPILCELTGYGLSSDANHMTAPAPEHEGGQRSMKMALKDAGLRPDQIDHINAHATSTPIGDGLESVALKKIFGDHAKKLWVSGTKSMTGHLLGAAGAIESVFCVLALRDQVVPPTINLKNPSEDCDLDYVAGEARAGKIHHVLNNSFGFGGTNGTLIFSKYN